MKLFRIDKVLANDDFEKVAWFVRSDTALAYVREFATDTLNWKFDYRIVVEEQEENKS